MKIAACLVLLLSICFFERKTAVKQGVNDKIDTLLLGKWTMCESHHGEGVNESAIMANVCTAWLFKSDHTGAVGLGAPYYPFHWSITGKTLYIKNKKGTDFIRNGAYKITEQKSKTFRTIIIADTTLSIRYFLLQ